MANKVTEFIFQNPVGQGFFFAFCILMIVAILIGSLFVDGIRKMIAWCDWDQ